MLELRATTSTSKQRVYIRVEKFTERSARSDISRMIYDEDMHGFRQTSREVKELGHLENPHELLKQLTEREQQALED